MCVLTLTDDLQDLLPNIGELMTVWFFSVAQNKNSIHNVVLLVHNQVTSLQQVWLVEPCPFHQPGNKLLL